MTGTPEWMAEAACRGVSTDVMVPRPPTRGRPEDELRYHRDVRAAKAICAGCAVVEPCLEWAITRREVGVWGGTSEQERRRIRDRRRGWERATRALFDRIRAELAMEAAT